LKAIDAGTGFRFKTAMDRGGVPTIAELMALLAAAPVGPTGRERTAVFQTFNPEGAVPEPPTKQTPDA
jgi:hypothetical protein